MDAKRRKWLDNNKEKVREYAKQYYAKHKEKMNKQVAAWRKQNSDYGPIKGDEWRKKHKKRYQSYRKADYKLQQEALAGRPMPDNCEICNTPRLDKALHFDHDHKTGKFRGWICMHCNSALGMAKDSVDVLEKMIEYLKK